MAVLLVQQWKKNVIRMCNSIKAQRKDIFWVSRSFKGHTRPYQVPRSFKGHTRPYQVSRSFKGHTRPYQVSRSFKGHTIPYQVSMSFKGHTRPYQVYIAFFRLYTLRLYTYTHVKDIAKAALS